MLKHKTAFDIPKVSNVEKDIVDSAHYRIPARINPGGSRVSVDVDGDGTCLFHAFLLSTVGMMRTLPNSERVRIGRMFRTLLYQENKDKAGFKFKGRRAFSKDIEEYVNDDALMFLINEFKVNVCLIEGKKSVGSATYDIGECRLYIFNAAAPYIILYNKSRIHFTPVKVGDRYLFSDPLRDVETVLRNNRIPHVVFTSPDQSKPPFIVPENEIGIPGPHVPIRGMSELGDLSNVGSPVRGMSEELGDLSDFGSPVRGMSDQLNNSGDSVDRYLNSLAGGRTRLRVTRKRAIRRKTRNKR